MPKGRKKSSSVSKGSKVPECFIFSGEDSKSTIEHIARFSVQCGETGSKDYLKLRLFANSLTNLWYPSKLY